MPRRPLRKGRSLAQSQARQVGKCWYVEKWSCCHVDLLTNGKFINTIYFTTKFLGGSTILLFFLLWFLFWVLLPFEMLSQAYHTVDPLAPVHRHSSSPILDQISVLVIVDWVNVQHLAVDELLVRGSGKFACSTHAVSQSGTPSIHICIKFISQPR